MADENKGGGVTMTDSRAQTRGAAPAGATAPVAPQTPVRSAITEQPQAAPSDGREQQKVRVKALAAFNSPDGFKNHESEPFEATRDWAVQARANGIVEYVDEADHRHDVEQQAKTAADNAREAANRRRPGATLADEHKSTPLQPTPIVMKTAK